MLAIFSLDRTDGLLGVGIGLYSGQKLFALESRRNTSAKGRNWFGMFAVVRQSSPCPQIAAPLSAVVRGSVLSIIVFAVSFAGMKGSPLLLLIWVFVNSSGFHRLVLMVVSYFNAIKTSG